VIRKVRPPLVIVVWLDAATSTEECTAEALHNIDRNVTHTCGWLLKRDGKGAYLVTDWLECGEMRCVSFIPNGMIKAVRTVRPERKSK
jgi:hypothetical protein